MNLLTTRLIDGHWLKLWHAILFLGVLCFIAGTFNGWYQYAQQAANTVQVSEPKQFTRSTK